MDSSLCLSSTPSLSRLSPFRHFVSFPLFSSQHHHHHHQQQPLIKGLTPLKETQSCALNLRLHLLSHVHRSNFIIPNASNMAAGHTDGPGKLYLERSIEYLKQIWETMPQPVKSFPWPEVLENFFQIICGLVYAVVKYLSIPLLAVSSLSEMSYCAQERKMILIPFPLLAGFAVAGILKDTAIELSSDSKKEEYPWHLLSIAIFFTFLKLPGPCYPYWARILVPHFANGGLWRTFWFALQWYRKPRENLTTTPVETSGNELSSENKS